MARPVINVKGLGTQRAGLSDPAGPADELVSTNPVGASAPFYRVKNAADVIYTLLGDGRLELPIFNSLPTSLAAGQLFLLDDGVTQSLVFVNNDDAPVTLAQQQSAWVAGEPIDGSTTPMLVTARSGEAGKVFALDADDTAPVPTALGFVTVLVSTNDPLQLVTTGDLTFPMAGWTAGLPVYASPITPGTLTQTPPSLVGQHIVPVGVARSSDVLAVQLQTTYTVQPTPDIQQDVSVRFLAPSDFDVAVINAGDVVVLDDSVEADPRLTTTGNFTLYRCKLQYIGNGDAITGPELVSNFAFDVASTPVGTIVVSTPTNIKDLELEPGTLVALDDSADNCPLVPGLTTLGIWPTLICTSAWTGTVSKPTRAQLEASFRVLGDIELKFTAQTDNDTDSVFVDFSSNSFEAYHVTMRVLADGSNGTKYASTHQFMVTISPEPGGIAVIQGSVNSVVIYNGNPTNVSVEFYSGIDNTVELRFISTGDLDDVYSWVAWMVVRRQ